MPGAGRRGELVVLGSGASVVEPGLVVVLSHRRSKDLCGKAGKRSIARPFLKAQVLSALRKLPPVPRFFFS